MSGIIEVGDKELVGALTLIGAVFNEQAADPSTPSTGQWRLYAKGSGVYIIDDEGTIYGPLTVALGTNELLGRVTGAPQGIAVAENRLVGRIAGGTLDDLGKVDLPDGTPGADDYVIGFESTGALVRFALLHGSRHEKNGVDAIRIDDLDDPQDNTKLNVSAIRHGLCPKLPGTSTYFFNGSGSFSQPDHGSIGGLGDDDHSQYHNDTRGDARYYTQSQVDALIAALNKLDRGLYRKTPTASDNFRIFYTSRDITITKVRGTTDTGTVTFQIKWRPWTSPFSGGTDVLSSSLVADSDGAETTSFADATIPAGSVVCYVSSATGSSPAELEVYVEATVD